MDKEKLKKIREAMANYISSEGCSCCSNYEKHNLHRDVLGKLLKVPKYKDGSGSDFGKYETK